MAKKPYISTQELIKIANKIKQLRISSGYTSYETFAIENEIDRKQYWRIEKGTNITLSTLIKLLNIHKISWIDFFKELE